MNKKYHSLILISFILATIISCGGGGGAPGSDFGDTGIMIKSAILARPAPDSPDIDTLQDCCTVDNNGFCTTVEVFTREDAVLDITTENLTPAITAAHFPAKVQECTVAYIKANEDPAAPIIESLTIFPNCTLLEGSNSCNVTVMDITRKLQYSTPVILNQTVRPAERPTHYVARMMCTYTNNFGKSGSFEAVLDIWLDNFNNC